MLIQIIFIQLLSWKQEICIHLLVVLNFFLLIAKVQLHTLEAPFVFQTITIMV